MSKSGALTVTITFCKDRSHHLLIALSNCSTCAPWPWLTTDIAKDFNSFNQVVVRIRPATGSACKQVIKTIFILVWISLHMANDCFASPAIKKLTDSLRLLHSKPITKNASCDVPTASWPITLPFEIADRLIAIESICDFRHCCGAVTSAPTSPEASLSYSVTSWLASSFFA